MKLNQIIKKATLFLKLYRTDVPVIVFLATFAGRIFTTGFSPSVIFEALFLALFPYNFVYTLNSITDVAEDSVNKPWRPIPSGSISQKHAFIWLVFLAIASVAGISFLFKGIEMFLAFLIIFLGFSYSIPPLIIKKNPVLASIVTGWGVTHPLFITGGLELISLSFSVMLHAIGTTMLKDLSDIKGDKAAGRRTLSQTKGVPTVLILSVIFMICAIIAFLFTQYKIAASIPAVSIFIVLYHYFFKRKDFADTIYKRIIWTTAVLAIAAITVIELI